MEPIGNVNPALEALRRQLAENIERMRKLGKFAGPSSHRVAQPQPDARSLESILQRRLATIDRRSPEGKARAAYVFAESVLVAEFGEALLSDPGLGQMLVDIAESLREDPQIRDQLDEMLGGL